MLYTNDKEKKYALCVFLRALFVPIPPCLHVAACCGSILSDIFIQIVLTVSGMSIHSSMAKYVYHSLSEANFTDSVFGV